MRRGSRRWRYCIRRTRRYYVNDAAFLDRSASHDPDPGDDLAKVFFLYPPKSNKPRPPWTRRNTFCLSFFSDVIKMTMAERSLTREKRDFPLRCGTGPLICVPQDFRFQDTLTKTRTPMPQREKIKCPFSFDEKPCSRPAYALGRWRRLARAARR